MLRPAQQVVYDYVRRHGGTRIVLAMHRGAGKSYYSTVEACEAGLLGKKVKMAAPTAKMMSKITLPHFREILLYCPKDLKPRYDATHQVYHFEASGGMIEIASGAAHHADALRGTDTDLFLPDECGFMDALPYILNDVIRPRLRRDTGIIIFPSTPPKSPSHPYADIMRAAEAEGSLFRLTCYDNPELSEAHIEAFAKDMGGKDSTSFRREMLCQLVTDQAFAIIPESQKLVITDEKEQSELPCVSVEYRSQGLTAVLCVETKHPHLFVSEEVFIPNATLYEVAESIKKMRESRSLDRVRVVCNTDSIIPDLRRQYGVAAFKVPNQDPQASLGVLRSMLSDGSLRVHSSCRQLIRHIRDGVWNDTYSSFESSGDSGYFEGISALAHVTRLYKPQRTSPSDYDMHALVRSITGLEYLE